MCLDGTLGGQTNQTQLEVAGHCNTTQAAEDAWDTENRLLASGHNPHRSVAGSVFANVVMFVSN